MSEEPQKEAEPQPEETIEETFARVLQSHDLAIQGMGYTLMECLGRLAQLEAKDGNTPS